ncbi:DUF1707 domain-containing protein [Amycolatopsis sp. 195334CR]|uniref:DUF1707 SHOCT-like domain-containing protein n=1 Tax=Amycolatopsis sp. 195334CR TaxID=2814588 RepID=UPI001A8DF61B|nr:DUF1707 domain-containing protein [Amycolatopsis sp. 195334CR]MBN6035636.1 DUF1707 domain-containing protein [Amycolatopsis sp. 195334CR]
MGEPQTDQLPVPAESDGDKDTVAEAEQKTAVETPAAPEAPEAPPSPKEFSPRDLRVSDAEREHVVGVLQKAIGRGMLDLDEFTERTDKALASRTRGELNSVLADLPGLVHRDAAPVLAAGAAPAPVPPPHPYAPPPSGKPLELRAHGSNLKRSGQWQVPSHLRVRNKYASTKLDFTEAVLTSPVVYIELDTKWGGVELVVPEEAGVDLNSITEVKWGSVEDKRKRQPAAGSPTIIVTGRVHGGPLVVRNGRRSRW